MLLLQIPLHQILDKGCFARLKAQKNDLYLQHETMLDEENQKRKDLADGFQDRMKGLSDTINEQKIDR